MRWASCQVPYVNRVEPFYWCDNRCSEKAIRYRQIASMVIEECGEAPTFNLCQWCYNAEIERGLVCSHVESRAPLNPWRTDMAEMNPNFVVARLVFWRKT